MRRTPTLPDQTPTVDPIAEYLRAIVRDEIRAALADLRREPADGELVSAARLCEILDLCLPTVRKHTASGLLPSVRVGDSVRYDVAEVREALRRRRDELAGAPRRARRG
ncbi:MAG: helix-turn-helix domain-containing protein [Polyangiaceae bacterium]|nr:helix-turn-helix domain-containing protein [Polyangiaceae bacterium]